MHRWLMQVHSYPAVGSYQTAVEAYMAVVYTCTGFRPPSAGTDWQSHFRHVSLTFCCTPLYPQKATTAQCQANTLLLAPLAALLEPHSADGTDGGTTRGRNTRKYRKGNLRQFSGDGIG